jgi:hypothetical protein
MANCYSCEEELKIGGGKILSEYGLGSESGGLVCEECEQDYEPCYVCEVLCDPGSQEAGHCESCQRYFHMACDRGWHSNPYDFYCSECGPRASRSEV